MRVDAARVGDGVRAGRAVAGDAVDDGVGDGDGDAVGDGDLVGDGDFAGDAVGEGVLLGETVADGDGVFVGDGESRGDGPVEAGSALCDARAIAPGTLAITAGVANAALRMVRLVTRIRQASSRRLTAAERLPFVDRPHARRARDCYA